MKNQNLVKYNNQHIQDVVLNDNWEHAVIRCKSHFTSDKEIQDITEDLLLTYPSLLSIAVKRPSTITSKKYFPNFWKLKF